MRAYVAWWLLCALLSAGYGAVCGEWLAALASFVGCLSGPVYAQIRDGVRLMQPKRARRSP